MDVFDPRSMILKGIVQAVKDDGQVQRVQIKVADGAVYDNVEVMQMFGAGSMPPLDGAVALVLAVGGDPGNWVALPVANPSRRFGNLGSGEAVLYGDNGDRVAIRSGGTIEIFGATVIHLKSPDVVIDATGAGGTVTIQGNATVHGTGTVLGNLDVTGNINAGGTISP